MWQRGTFKGYSWEAKVFNDGSEYGIDGGRVSKLCVRDNDRNWIINYDRGWDVIPENEEMETWLEEFLQWIDDNIPMYEV